MQLEVKLRDALPTLVAIQRDLIQTSVIFKNRLEEYTARNERYQNTTQNLGWREKYFEGSFGGDKATVARLKNEFTDLTNFRKSLVELEKNIKSIQQSFEKEIIHFLSKESPEYISYELLLQSHHLIVNESARFYDSIADVKRKISDALVLTSWKSLLNHNKAAMLLQQFYNEVEAYNQKVEKYQSHVKCDLLNVNLLEIIDVSSQSSAMDSLNGLLIKSEAILNYANEQITLIHKKRVEMMDHVKSLISQKKN